MAYVSVSGLEIIKVADAGDLQKERVILRMEESVSLINFVLIDSHAKDDSGTVFDLNESVFWFPDQVVNQGDYVRLYSKGGVNATQQGTYEGRQATFHNFFWGKNNSVWDSGTNTVVVFRVQTWLTKKVL